MYDLVIVGGGPAGATLARLIGKNFKILLLEKRDFTKPAICGNQKCCGGLIAPDAQRMLASFGLGVPKSVLTGPQLFSVRTIDLNNSVERYYQRNYVNINREEFDKWLVSLIPDAVNVVTGCFYKSFLEEGDYLKIRYSQDGRDVEVRTKLLVGADGAFSRVRWQAYPHNEVPQKYIAIQEWYETQSNTNYYGAIFDETITDFYAWTIPKEKYLILGAALLPDRDSIHRFESLKDKLNGYGFQFQHCVKREGAYLLRPEKVSQIKIGSGRIGLIGEAAGFISPSSAEGLSYAFKSALALAKAIETNPDMWYKLYQREVRGLFLNIVGKNFKAPFMYNDTLRKTIMRSGLMGLKIDDP